MNKSISVNNLRQAATHVAQFCKLHSNGKARQSTVMEALSQFLGHKNANTALASAVDSKDAQGDVESPVRLVYILTYKGIPTVHLTEESLVGDIISELKDIPFEDLNIYTSSLLEDIHPQLVINDGHTYKYEHDLISVQRVDMEEDPCQLLSDEQREVVRNPNAESFKAVLEAALKEKSRGSGKGEQ